MPSWRVHDVSDDVEDVVSEPVQSAHEVSGGISTEVEDMVPPKSGKAGTRTIEIQVGSMYEQGTQVAFDDAHAVLWDRTQLHPAPTLRAHAAQAWPDQEARTPTSVLQGAEDAAPPGLSEHLKPSLGERVQRNLVEDMLRQQLTTLRGSLARVAERNATNDARAARATFRYTTLEETKAFCARFKPYPDAASYEY